WKRLWNGSGLVFRTRLCRRRFRLWSDSEIPLSLPECAEAFKISIRITIHLCLTLIPGLIDTGLMSASYCVELFFLSHYEFIDQIYRAGGKRLRPSVDSSESFIIPASVGAISRISIRPSSREPAMPVPAMKSDASISRCPGK